MANKVLNFKEILEKYDEQYIYNFCSEFQSNVNLFFFIKKMLNVAKKPFLIH